MIQQALSAESEGQGSVTLVENAWAALQDGDLEKVLYYTNKCINLYDKRAKLMQAKLEDFPRGGKDEIHRYWALNDVATAYYIQAEGYRKAGSLKKARQVYQRILDEYAYGQCWDPRGWFWKPSEAAENCLNDIVQN